MSNFKKITVIFILVAIFTFLPTNYTVAQISPKCLPFGCIPFGGPILSFIPFVPFCGPVITIGLPKPMTAIYIPQLYLYNPPIPTIPFGPARPGSQNAIGLVNLLNLNLLCPLPRVVSMGVSFFRGF